MFEEEDAPKLKICTYEGCHKPGEYKAPLSPKSLRQYQWFCLDHIQEFNKGWDYYKGWSQKQIELDIKNKSTWHRPSWKINQDKADSFDDSLLRQRLESFYTADVMGGHWDAALKPDAQSIPFNLLNKNEREAFEFFKLTPTRDFEQIKKTYKKLAKQYHPDHNEGSKKAEEKFKLVNQHYAILKKLLTKL